MPLLEATAVIKAKDETGPAFLSVERRIAELQKAVTSVGVAMGSTNGAIGNTQAMIKELSLATRETDALANAMGRVGAAVLRVNRDIGATVRSMGNASRAAAAVRGGAGRGEGGGGFGEFGGIIAPTLGMGAMFAGYEGLRELLKANFERGHERTRMLTSGMSLDDIKNTEMSAAELSAKYSPIGQNEIMHMIRNTRSVVGSTAEAMAIMDPLLALRTVATSAHPDQNMEEDFDKLVKGMEIKGVTQDLPKFGAYMNAMGKTILAFGDTIRPTDFYEAFKYGRQATQTLSLDYLQSAGPKIIQDLGGASAGTAQSAFYKAIVGGHMEKTALKALAGLGLVESSYSPGGGHLASGKIRGRDLAAVNPYEWVNQILLPAMAKKGIVDPLKIQEVINTLFSKGTAAQLVSLLATQQSAIEKDTRIQRGTEGLDDAARRFIRDDPTIAAKGLSESLKNLATNIAGGDVEIAHGLNNMANGFNSAAVFFQRVGGLPGLLDPPKEARDAWDRVAKTGTFDPDEQRNLLDPGAIKAHEDMLQHDKLVAAQERLQKRLRYNNPEVLGYRLYGESRDAARLGLPMTTYKDGADSETYESEYLRSIATDAADAVATRNALAALNATVPSEEELDAAAAAARRVKNLHGSTFFRGYPGAPSDRGHILPDHVRFGYWNTPFGNPSFHAGPPEDDPIHKMLDFQGAQQDAAYTIRQNSRDGALADIHGGDLKVSLDPNSKVSVDVNVHADEGSILKLVTWAVAKATGSAAASVGASTAGGIGHR